MTNTGDELPGIRNDTVSGRVPKGTGLSQAEPVARLGPSGVDPSRCRLERYDSISQRIVDDQGFVMGLVLQLSNGRWLVEIDGERVGPWTCNTAKAAFLTWRNKASAIEAGTAETTQIGSVHESAGPKDDAQGGAA